MKEIQDFDDLIRQAGKDECSQEVVSGVMEAIESMPAHRSVTEALFPLWFKMLMTVVFSGALIFIFVTGTSDNSVDSRFTEYFFSFIQYITAFIMTWLHRLTENLWVLPSFLFVIAGILFILSDRHRILTEIA